MTIIRKAVLIVAGFGATFSREKQDSKMRSTLTHGKALSKLSVRTVGGLIVGQ